MQKIALALMVSAFLMVAGCDNNADISIKVAEKYIQQDLTAEFRNNHFYPYLVSDGRTQGYVCGEFREKITSGKSSEFKRYLAVVWLNNRTAGDLTWAWYDQTSYYRQMIIGLDFEYIWDESCKEHTIAYE